MKKKIIITLLLISPIVISALEVFCPRPKIAPPQTLVGAWETEAETRVGKLRVSFNLYEDGTVEGTVGNATMQNAYFRRNISWIFAILGWPHYIIVTDLKGAVANEVQSARFYILVSDFDEKGIRGDIACKECSRDGKKESPFGAGPLIFTRVEQP